MNSFFYFSSITFLELTYTFKMWFKKDFLSENNFKKNFRNLQKFL